MNPSKLNTSVETAANDSQSLKLTTPCPASVEKQSPAASMDSSNQSSASSASVLPSSGYDPAASDAESPSNRTILVQDSNDWKILNGSSSGVENMRHYPPTSPRIEEPGPIWPGTAIEATIPTGGYASCGALAMPITASLEGESEIGYTTVVTEEPKSANLGLRAEGYGPTVRHSAHDSITDIEVEFRSDTALGKTVNGTGEEYQEQRLMANDDYCCGLCCCIRKRIKAASGLGANH